MEERARKQAEMSRELRGARTWLIVVAVVGFAMDMLFFQVLKLPNGLADAVRPDQVELRQLGTVLALVLFGVLGTLWLFAPRRPKLCLTLALVVYWGTNAVAIAQEPANAYRGLLLKVLFTAALLKGIKSAGKSEELSRELGQVFE